MVVVVTKKSRHESRIDTGQFPKQARACRVVRRRASPPGNFCGFSLLQFPFPGFLSHSDRVLVRSQLWKCFFIVQNIFIMKKVTDFRETVETGVDPRLKSLSNVRSSFILWSLFWWKKCKKAFRDVYFWEYAKKIWNKSAPRSHSRLWIY